MWQGRGSACCRCLGLALACLLAPHHIRTLITQAAPLLKPTHHLPPTPQATSLLHAGSRVEGVEYTDQRGERQRLEASAVILATGGFGASAHLLRQYAPQVGRVAGWWC